jgi:hypothetical protein
MADFQDLSEKELKFGYWFLTHKLLLRKILIIFLIVFSVGFFAYAIYGLVIELVVYGQSFNSAMQSLPQNLVNFSGYKAKNQAKDLQVSSITVIAGAGERYDFVAKVKNPNPNWTVESFDYQFITGIDEVDFNKDKNAPNPDRVKRSFILPGEEKYLVDLSVESKRRIGQARLDITNLKWRRVTDFATTQKEKFRFEISDVQFIPATATEISGKLPISQVTFNAANKSAYGFWNVGFYIILFKGSAMGGANYLSIDQFLSGQTRALTVNWFESLPNITQVQVVPEVNILDKNIYMEVKGDGGVFR